MKSTNYSEKVLEHFKHPQNVGTLAGPDVASGRVGNPTCGDIMEMYIKVNNDVIEDIKFQTFGCGSAVATSSMITVMAKGMTIDDAYKITRKDVANELEGLPPIKMHCSNLAADALQAAIDNYRKGEIGVEDIENDANSKGEIQTLRVEGELEYLGKGVSYNIQNIDDFQDQRVLVLHKSDLSIDMAIELTKYTGRVILATQGKEIVAPSPLKKALLRSDVKLLAESQLLAVSGEGEVEQVKIRDLDEKEEYTLFVDRVVIPASLSMPTSCDEEVI